MRKTFLMVAALVLLLAPLAAQSVKVVSPNGNESWALNSPQLISWTAPGITKKLKIVLFKDGHNVGSIAADLDPGSSPFSWVCGQSQGGTAIAAGGYKIYVGTMDNSVEDFSDNAFTIGGAQPVVIQAPPYQRIPPQVLKLPKMEVSGIDLVPNAEGFAIIFSYKNTGAAPWPKASEVPVKPNYRVLLGTTETAKGSLFIPVFPAPPDWEQWGYFGGQVVFPDRPANIYEADNNLFQHTGGFGREIGVVINENKVMGMSSHQLVRKLEPMANKYYYDLIVEKIWYVWSTHMLNIVLKLEGKIPANGKFDLICKTSVSHNNVFQPEKRRFHVTQAMGNRFYSFAKKVDLPSDCDQVEFIVYAIGSCDGNQQQKVCDFDMGNNRIRLVCPPGSGCSTY